MIKFLRQRGVGILQYTYDFIYFQVKTQCSSQFHERTVAAGVGMAIFQVLKDELMEQHPHPPGTLLPDILQAIHLQLQLIQIPPVSDLNSIICLSCL